MKKKQIAVFIFVTIIACTEWFIIPSPNIVIDKDQNKKTEQKIDQSFEAILKKLNLKEKQYQEMISKSKTKPRKEREQILSAIYNEKKKTVLSLSFNLTEEQEKKFREIGYEVIQSEGMVELVANFGNLKYNPNLPKSWQKWFTLGSEMPQLIDDAMIAVPFDTIRVWLKKYEDFKTTYPDFTEKETLAEKINWLYNIYTCGSDNSPIHDEKGRLYCEVRQSYNRFLRENRQSCFYKEFKVFYKLQCTGKRKRF